MFYISATTSLVFLLALLIAAKSRHRTRNSLLISVVAIIVLPILSNVSQAAMLQLVLVFVAILGCAACGARAAVFRVTMIAATTLAYAVVSFFAFQDARHARVAVQKYPFESLGPRLEYEAEHLQAVSSTNRPLNDRWNEISLQQNSHNGRERALWRIHMLTVRSFIDNPAFGVRRMITLKIDSDSSAKFGGLI